MRTPTTVEIIDSIVTKIESEIGQQTPLLQKAFNRVLATALGLVVSGLYKFGKERSRQNLALSATGSDLEDIGKNYGVYRKPGVPAVVDVTVDGNVGASIPITAAWRGEHNGVIYYPDVSIVLEGTSGILRLVATVADETGNSVEGDEFTLVHPLAGVSSTAVFSAMPLPGLDREDIEFYRRRILNEIRTVGGGGNLTDYRTWAEETPGVRRVFPYSGQDLEGWGGNPGDRAVFVQAVSGPAEGPLLAAVRQQINFDPVTGARRPPLGHTDGTLYIYPVNETAVSVNIWDLVTPSGAVVELVESDIEEAVTLYLASMQPFLVGLDSSLDRNDTLTLVSLGAAIQPALAQHESSVSKVGFSIVTPRETYSLGQGEVFVLGEILYNVSGGF
jgi:uncharacterized phage protein gp47/JayE